MARREALQQQLCREEGGICAAAVSRSECELCPRVERRGSRRGAMHVGRVSAPAKVCCVHVGYLVKESRRRVLNRRMLNNAPKGLTGAPRVSTFRRRPYGMRQQVICFEG